MFLKTFSPADFIMLNVTVWNDFKHLLTCHLIKYDYLKNEQQAVCKDFWVITSLVRVYQTVSWFKANMLIFFFSTLVELEIMVIFLVNRDVQLSQNKICGRHR